MPKLFPLKGVLQGFSVDNGLWPEKGPYITETYLFDMSASNEAVFDLRATAEARQLQLSQTIIIDNSESSSPLSLEAMETNFRLVVPPYAQAIMPFFGGRAPVIRLRWTVNAGTARLQFYNVPVPPFMEVVASAPVTFDPASLFAGGFSGVWYDLSDVATLFQLSGGTVPVAAPGDPIGYIGNKSGTGAIPAIQATAGNRPIFQGSGGKFWMEFDGISQVIASAASGIPLAFPHTAFVACQRGTNVNSISFGASQINTNDYAVFNANTSGRASAGTRSVGLGYAPVTTLPTSINSFDNSAPRVLRREMDATPGDLSCQIDALSPVTVAANIPAATSLGSTIFYPGPTLANQGPAFRCYQFLWINRLLTAPETANLYAFFAAKI